MIISVPRIKGKNDISHTEVDPGEHPTMSAIISQRIQIIHFYYYFFETFYITLLCVVVNSGIKGKQDDIGNYWPASNKRRGLVTEDSEASVMNIYKTEEWMESCLQLLRYI